MRVHIAADHAGYDLKSHLIEWLGDNDHDVVDHGAFELDPDDDYPVFCISAAEAVASDSEAIGVVIGGWGNGEQIAASKGRGIRAVLGWSVQSAALGREQDDGNGDALGGRTH